MSTINETLTKIGSSKVISTFDAKSGYWQITVSEEDRWLTAFVRHDGLYEWVRMPFGLKNAGATFVRAIRSVLTPICDFFLSHMLTTSVLSLMTGRSISTTSDDCWGSSKRSG